jgi:catechol 2,3-dioxygenase-like lactoylglutathione lyase family enzyme
MSIRIHLSFPTADLDAAVGFYTTLFGEGPDKTRPEFARFAPAAVPISLSLHAASDVAIGGAAHFGLRMADAEALAAARARLREAGLVTSTEEAETCCWAVQDKSWAQDPDGREWEVYIVLDDAPETERSPDTSCCVTPVAATPSCCG